MAVFQDLCLQPRIAEALLFLRLMDAGSVVKKATLGQAFLVSITPPMFMLFHLSLSHTI